MTRAFRRYPICWCPLDQSGLGSDRAPTRARAMLQLAVRELQYVLQHIVIEKTIVSKTSFSNFIAFFSSLSTKHNWRHNCQNHGRRWRKWPPSAPHEALRSTPMPRMDGWQPPELADVFMGGFRMFKPSQRSFVPAIMHCHNIGVFWRPYTPSTAAKITSACLGVVAHPFNMATQSARPHVGH